eukprot:2787437-Pleurochrysis_carterae.AAC.1
MRDQTERGRRMAAEGGRRARARRRRRARQRGNGDKIRGQGGRNQKRRERERCTGVANEIVAKIEEIKSWRTKEREREGRARGSAREKP